jgi:hypothetical protein
MAEGLRHSIDCRGAASGYAYEHLSNIEQTQHLAAHEAEIVKARLHSEAKIDTDTRDIVGQMVAPAIGVRIQRNSADVRSPRRLCSETP